MSSGYTWDGVDLDRWNVQVMDVSGHLDLPMRKKPTGIDFGVDTMGGTPFVLANDIVVESRNIKLRCYIKETTEEKFHTKLAAFKSTVCATGMHTLSLKNAYNDYRVYQKDKGSFRSFKIDPNALIAEFDWIVREPKPTPPALTRGLVGHWSLSQSDESLGLDVVTNGTFTTDVSWTKSAAWTITSGKAVCSGAQSVNTTLYQAVTLTTNASYRMDYTLSAYTAGTLWPYLTQGVTVLGQPRVGNGSFTEYLDAADNTRLNFIGNSLFQAKLDDVILKPVAATDLSVYTNNADFYRLSGGTIYATDRKSTAVKALDFDGVNDYVDTGDTFQTTFRNSFSVSLWCKPDDGRPGSAEYLFGTRQSSDDRLWLEIRTTGAVDFMYTSDGDNSDARTGVILANGQETWHHIVATLNNESNLIDIYFDGVKQSLSGSFPGLLDGITMSDYTSTQNLYLGARNNAGTADGFFAGDLHDIRIYDRAISAEEVKYLYKLYNNALDY